MNKNYEILINRVLELKNNSDIKKIIDDKINEFSKFQNKNNLEWFYEICFCLLTANFQAKKSIEIQKKLIENNGFIDFPQEKLAIELKKLGHRFYNMRAKYIVLARKFQNNIKDEITKIDDIIEKRNWIVENFVGIGFKEASHFLRNTGHFNYAILDFHIIDILVNTNLIEKPKTLNKKKYLEIEEKLFKLCDDLKISQGELDFYLWYLETNTILK